MKPARHCGAFFCKRLADGAGFCACPCACCQGMRAYEDLDRAGYRILFTEDEARRRTRQRLMWTRAAVLAWALAALGAVALAARLLLGCGGEEFAEAPLFAEGNGLDAVAESDNANRESDPPVESGEAEAQADAGSLRDAGLLDADSAVTVDAPPEADAFAEADGEADAGVDAFVCPSAFPDGGWTCGSGWINAANSLVCVAHGGVATSPAGPVNSYCGPHYSCVSCATCDAGAMCRDFFDAGYLGCDDPGGKVTVDCIP